MSIVQRLIILCLWCATSLCSLEVLATEFLTLGPISQEHELNEVTRYLDDQNLNHEQSTQPDRQSLGYIVVSDLLSSPREGQRIIDTLSAIGITDLLYISRGDYEGRVSAGVFSRLPTATRRADHLVALGADFQVIERSRTFSVQRIIVTSLPTGTQETELWRLMGDQRFTRHDEAFERILQADSRESTEAPRAPVQPADSIAEAVDAEPVDRPDPVAAKTVTPGTSPAVTQPRPRESTPAIVRPDPESTSLWPWLLGAFVMLAAVSGWFILRTRTKSANVTKSTSVRELPRPPILTTTAEIDEPQDPLRIVQQYAAGLLQGDPPKQNALSTVTADHNAAGLLHDVLLLLSDRNEIHSPSYGFNLPVLLDQVISSYEDFASDKGVFLNYSNENLPEYAASDPMRLSRVVGNLIYHCVDQAQAGRITLSADFDPTVSYLSLQVSYPGDGTDPQALLTADAAEASNSVQVLRLAITRRLLEDLGGNLTAHVDEDLQTHLDAGLSIASVSIEELQLPNGSTVADILEFADSQQSVTEEHLVHLEQLQADAAREATAREETEQKLREEIQALGLALSEATDRVRQEEAGQSALREESDVHVSELQSQLEILKQRLEQESAARLEADSALTDAEASVVSARRELEEETQRRAALESAHAENEQKKQDFLAEISSLSTELEQSRHQLNQTIEGHQSAERQATGRILQLEEAVMAAEQTAQQRLVERDALQAQAESAVQALEHQLEAVGEEAETMGARQGDYREETERLQQALEQLDQESSRLAKVADDAHRQVQYLKSELDEAQQVLGAHTEEREQLIDQVTRLDRELAAAAEALQAEQHNASQALESRQQEYETSLQAELESRRALEEEADGRVKTLESALNEAQQQAEQESSRRQEMEAEYGRELDQLREQLSGSQHLAEELQVHSEDRLNADAEVAALRKQITQLEENIQTERARIGVADEAAGTQISHLMDELNQARTIAEREKKSRQQFEQDSHELMQSVQQELSSTREQLQQEIRFRENQEVILQENANRMQKQLRAALARTKSLQQRSDGASVQLLEAEGKLEDVRNDALNYQRAENAAREQIKLLEAQIDKLQNNQPAALSEQLAAAREEAANYARAEAMAREQIEIMKAQMADPVQATSSGMPEIETVLPPVRSNLPVGNPINRVRVERFTVRLSQQLQAMEQALARQDYLSLMVLSNWLKSEAHALGFSDFLKPVQALELDLREQNFDPLPGRIALLKEMSWQIEIEDAPTEEIQLPHMKPSRRSRDQSPILLELSGNERKAELIENFVSQLGTHLTEMIEEWREEQSSQLEKHCNWIQKYGMRMGINDVVYAAEDLMEAVKDEAPSDITQTLLDFIHLYTRLRLVQQDN